MLLLCCYHWLHIKIDNMTAPRMWSQNKKRVTVILCSCYHTDVCASASFPDKFGFNWLFDDIKGGVMSWLTTVCVMVVEWGRCMGGTSIPWFDLPTTTFTSGSGDSSSIFIYSRWLLPMFTMHSFWTVSMAMWPLRTMCICLYIYSQVYISFELPPLAYT